MAHMNGDRGPFPDKAGEFCGNHLPDSPPVMLHDESPKEAYRHRAACLAMMRFGRPSNCPYGTSAEMAALGFVGLYLKEDNPIFDGSTPIETDALTEAVVSR